MNFLASLAKNKAFALNYEFKRKRGIDARAGELGEQGVFLLQCQDEYPTLRYVVKTEGRRKRMKLVRITSLAVVLAFVAHFAGAQSKTQVRFRNIGSERVNVVTDVGKAPTRSNFTLGPGKEEFVNVADGSLQWCAHKGNVAPCTPNQRATGGATVDVK